MKTLALHCVNSKKRTNDQPIIEIFRQTKLKCFISDDYKLI